MDLFYVIYVKFWHQSANAFDRFPFLGADSDFIVSGSLPCQSTVVFRGNSFITILLPCPSIFLFLFLLCQRSVLRIHVFPESCQFLEDTLKYLHNVYKMGFTHFC